MSKTLDTAASITVSTDGTVPAEEFWVQSSGLIAGAAKHGMDVEIKATFADNAAVEGDLTFYTVGSNDAGTTITSAAQAKPFAVFTPVQNTTVIAVVEVPTVYGDSIGFAVQNEDETYSATAVTIKYKTVIL